MDKSFDETKNKAFCKNKVQVCLDRLRGYEIVEDQARDSISSQVNNALEGDNEVKYIFDYQTSHLFLSRSITSCLNLSVIISISNSKNLKWIDGCRYILPYSKVTRYKKFYSFMFIQTSILAINNRSFNDYNKLSVS
ncbi:hypothetical protein BDC45DRAFT_533344 [Circinella umbellata]|nr:hypothetical protein BDC45DRAFT_533344 [Circinella umbellata]